MLLNNTIQAILYTDQEQYLPQLTEKLSYVAQSPMQPTQPQTSHCPHQHISADREVNSWHQAPYHHLSHQTRCLRNNATKQKFRNSQSVNLQTVSITTIPMYTLLQPFHLHV